MIYFILYLLSLSLSLTHSLTHSHTYTSFFSLMYTYYVHTVLYNYEHTCNYLEPTLYTFQI